MTRRRASREITLVLAAAALQGCSPDPASELVRDHYNSREECAADWGRPDWCEQTARGSSGGYYFRGPSYYAGVREAAQREARTQAGIGAQPPSNHSISRAPAGSTVRGGFGAMARGFSGGG